MSIPEVAEVEVTVSTKTATITTKPGTTVSREGVTAVLEKAGYGVTSFAPNGTSPPTGT
jgi:hypothetical protein